MSEIEFLATPFPIMSAILIHIAPPKCTYLSDHQTIYSFTLSKNVNFQLDRFCSKGTESMGKKIMDHD